MPGSQSFNLAVQQSGDCTAFLIGKTNTQERKTIKIIPHTGDTESLNMWGVGGRERDWLTEEDL